MSTRDFSWGKGGRCVWLTTYHPCSAERHEKSGAFTYPEPLGPPRSVAGWPLPLLLCIIRRQIRYASLVNCTLFKNCMMKAHSISILTTFKPWSGQYSFRTVLLAHQNELPQFITTRFLPNYIQWPKKIMLPPLPQLFFGFYRKHTSLEKLPFRPPLPPPFCPFHSRFYRANLLLMDTDDFRQWTAASSRIKRKSYEEGTLWKLKTTPLYK